MIRALTFGFLVSLALIATVRAAEPVRQVNLIPDFQKFDLPPHAQGNRDTCSLFAITSLAEFECARNSLPPHQRLSEEFLIWAARAATAHKQDQAMFYEAVHGLNRFGICTETHMPTGNKMAADHLGSTVWEEARAIQCARLRDIFGNPFEQAVVKPAWLLWKNGRVRREARAIYNQRRFDDLPRLGRVLEAAGCDDAEILAHCRQPSGHVLGCWVIDLLLEKREMRSDNRSRFDRALHRQPCPPGQPIRQGSWDPPAASALRRGIA